MTLEGSGRVRVLLRAERGRVRLKIRAFSEDCPLDVGGLALVWIEDVRPADSVALLATFVGQPHGDAREAGSASTTARSRRSRPTRDPSADSALERYVAPEQPLELRKKAAFWMGAGARRARLRGAGRPGAATTPTRRFREHVVFALTQSREPARSTRSSRSRTAIRTRHVRGQALFWLAQSAARRAPEAIRRRSTTTPRSKAFAGSGKPAEGSQPVGGSPKPGRAVAKFPPPASCKIRALSFAGAFWRGRVWPVLTHLAQLREELILRRPALQSHNTRPEKG